MNLCKVTLVLLSLLFICAGCGNKELSRNEAEKLITAYYQYPNVETHKLDYRSQGGVKNLDWLEANQFLISQGLLGHSETSEVIPYKTFDTVNTSTITVYATNMRRFKKITGVKYENPDKTKATVEYTAERYNITPFGKYRYAENEEVKYEVTIERYDDGWRITTPNRKNYTEADFPDVEEFLEN
jgi:hypothetical protein